MTRLTPPITALTLILAATGASRADESAAPELPLDLSASLPVADQPEPPGTAHRSLEDGPSEPEAPVAPETAGALDQPGNETQISVTETGFSATQQVALGAKRLPEKDVTIRPFIEIGTDIEKRDDDAPLVASTGLNADVKAGIGAGAAVSVTDRIDFSLGYSRYAQLDTLRQRDADEHRVKTGLIIRF